MISNRLPTTNTRPITRGLQRTAVKTANKRQLQDKSFWIGQLRTKMQEIQKETDKISKENMIARQENESYVIYEKNFEETSREITELQEALAEQNLILEKLSISAAIDDIIDEIEQKSVDNQRDQDTLENIFEDRRKREEECRNLIGQIDELESFQNEKISLELSEAEVENYKNLVSSVKYAREDVEVSQISLNEVEILVQQLKQEVSLDDNKSLAASMFSRLGDIRSKKQTLEIELARSEDPVKEQNRLNEMVKSGNAAITAMSSQLELLDKKIENNFNLLADKENELTLLNSSQAVEIKKLLKKQNQVNNMLSDWQENEGREQAEIVELEPKLVTLSEEVKRLKEGIKRLPELGDQNILESASSANKSGSKLQEEIMQILVLEKKLENESSALEEKISSYRADISTYSDVQSTRATAEEKRLALNTEREALQHNRNLFQQSTESKNRKLQRLKSLLDSNNKSQKIFDLRRKVKQLCESNLELSENIEQKLVDATPVRNKVLQIEQDHQNWLEDRLLKGLGIQLET